MAAKSVNVLKAEETDESSVVIGSGKYPDEKVYRVIAPSTENDQQAIQVGVNYDLFLIPRDKEVRVAAPLIHALDLAKQARYKNTPDGLIEFMAPQYNISILGEA